MCTEKWPMLTRDGNKQQLYEQDKKQQECHFYLAREAINGAEESCQYYTTHVLSTLHIPECCFGILALESRKNP